MKCKRCNEEYRIKHPALSRADNKTEICPFCGECEAYLCMIMGGNKIPKEEIKNALLALLDKDTTEYTCNGRTYLKCGSVKWETEGDL